MKHIKIKYLIEKLKQGKSEYFNKFYDETKSSVFYVIRKILNNKAQIEDVMQETYIKFIYSLHKINENQNPYYYLLQIAKNKAIDEYRKNKKIVLSNYCEETETENCYNFSLDFPLLDCCKKNLSVDEFKILELTVILGYKRVEVAKMLQQPISTVNWKYNKILKKIKTLYLEVYDEKK